MKQFNVDLIDRGTDWEHNTRRVVVKCQFCDNMTKQVSSVCPTCQYYMQVGKKYNAHLAQEQEAGADEQVQIILPRYLRINAEAAMTSEEYKAAYPLDEKAWSMRAIQEALVAAILQLAPITPTVPTRKPVQVLSRYTFGSDMTEGRTYICTQATADQLAKAIELVRLAIKEAQAEGYKKGSDMLCKLANGELTINDLNDKETRRK